MCQVLICLLDVLGCAILKRNYSHTPRTVTMTVTYPNQHLTHIAHLDPHLGNILIQFLKESDHGNFGSISYPQRVIDNDTIETMKRFENTFSRVLNHIETSDLVSTWSKQDLISNFGTLRAFAPDDCTPNSVLDVEWVKRLLQYAQFLYHSQAEHGKVQKLLYAVAGLTTQPELLLAAYWGILQCHILLKDWEAAWTNVAFINEMLSKGEVFSPVNVHLNREWLMTAALFVLSRHPDGASTLGAEFFMNSSQLNTIICGCQYLFRYAISFVLANRKRKSFMKDLFRFVQHESIKSIDDSIIQLLYACFTTYNFESVRELIENWKQDIKMNYFLKPLESELMDGTRTMVFEIYCKLHRQIKIDTMMHRLYLDNEYSKDDSEVWIVKAIQKSKIDAKIDSENGVIIVQSRHSIPYHHVIEKTKSQNLRTQMMAIHLDSISTNSVPRS